MPACLTRILLLVLIACPWPALAAFGEQPAGRLGGAAAFLPVHEAYQATARLDGRQLQVDWQIADGYYLYRHGFRSALPLALPDGQARHDEFFGDVEVYYGRLQLTLTLPAAPQALPVSLDFQGCADAGLCYPPATLHWQVDTRLGTVAPLVVPPAPASGPAASADRTLPVVLAFAFLGGILLNLMPCVFPVLGLKVIALTAPARRDSAWAHALAYAAGVILSFLAVATVLLALRAGGQAIGWGFQLQSPLVIAGLAWLFTGITVALAGGFSPGLRWLGAGQSLTEGGGKAASFFTGMLAVVVASPCTVPFMAAAVGYALVQPTPVTLGVFASLGAGMALPFMLLGLVPGLADRLPRPGPWMETLKQLLALPMAATVAWLLWVLTQQAGTGTLALVGAGCAVLAGSLYLAEKTRHRRPASVLALASLLVLLGTPATPPPQAGSGIDTRVQALRSEGRPVFLNVTADWCITCLANERLALGSDDTRALFAQQGVTYLEADWTRPDPSIGSLLARFGRSGVPLYVFYPADPAADPVVLPQLLTPALLQEALAAGRRETAR